MEFFGFSSEVSLRIVDTPFYSNILNRRGLLPTELRDPRALMHFPFISRDDLRKTTLDFVSPEEGLFPIYSTGTSGCPMRVYRGPSDELRFWKLVKEKLSLPSQFNVTFLCGLDEGEEYAWEKNYRDMEIKLSRHSYLCHPEEAIEALLASQLVTGSPKMLDWLNVQKNKYDLKGATYTTALPLSVVQHMDRHLHTYSTTETGPIGYYCPNSGDYHSFQDVYIEGAGKNIFAVTKLFSSGFPLIRYVTNDKGYVHNGSCPCGYRGVSIHQLQGRKG